MIGDRNWWANTDEEIPQAAARQRTQAEDRALEARALAEHLAPQEPTDAEKRHAVLERERERALAQRAKANRGQGSLIDEVRGQWRDG